MDRIVIVGAGLAGLSAAQELRRRGHRSELVIVGEEAHRPYRRPPLSKEFLGDVEVDTALRHHGLEATWLLGQGATGLDLAARRVLRGDAAAVPFDGLVIATGLRARALTGISEVPGVATLRTLEDARSLRARLVDRPRTVIAGAGFLGSEIASTLRAQGLEVTLVDRSDVPLRRPLGDLLGERVAEMHRSNGVDLRLGRTVTGVAGTGRLRSVQLDDGTCLPTDLLIVGVGADPATDWLAGSPLHVDGGVIVDQGGTAAPGVVAAGDVARWRHPVLGTQIRYEHYANAVDQGTRAARTLMGEIDPQPLLPSFWVELYGRRLQAVGFTGLGFDMHVVEGALGARFLAEYRHAGRVVGAATVGYVHRLPQYRALITKELT